MQAAALRGDVPLRTRRDGNMSNQELERARAELNRIGADFALLSSSENVTYVSHWEVPVDFGALATQNYAPTLALIGIKGSASVLLASASHASSAKATSDLDEIVPHEVSSMTAPVDAR